MAGSRTGLCGCRQRTFSSARSSSQRAGAGGAIGTESVVGAGPDGYILEFGVAESDAMLLLRAGSPATR